MQKQFSNSAIDLSSFLKKRKPENNKNKEKFHGKKKAKTDNVSEFKKQAESGQFRYQNEYLYTTDSKESAKYFAENKVELDIYHKGYNNQIASWPKRPLDCIISMIEKYDEKYKGCKLADLGCGLGEFYEHFYDKKEKSLKVFSEIHSYDLSAFKPHIKVADSANQPHEDESQDVVVFCQSLMGKNYLEFLKEASRVLVKKGKQIVAEVSSRFESFNAWSKMIESLGFAKKKIWYQNIAGYFILSVWEKTSDFKSDEISRNEIFFTPYKDEKGIALVEELKKQDFKGISNKLLKPCIYKKR